MSLEAKIDALTSAVQELTRAIVSQHNDLPTKEMVKEAEAVIKKAIAAEATGDISNDPPTSNTITDTSPPSSPESAPANSVTYDDVKGVTIAVSKIDKAKAVAALQRFGVATAKALKEEQWADYVVYMKRIAAGDVDPESSHE